MITRLRSRVSEALFPRLESIYSIVYLTLMMAGTSYVVWYESVARLEDGTAGTVYSIIEGISYVGVASAAITVALMEGGVAIMVLSRIMLERAEKRAEKRGRIEGKEEGKEEGKVENQKMWENWLRRKESAEAEGRSFDEPPPGVNGSLR